MLNHNYEIQGNSIIRQMRHWIRMKTTVMGNYATGPGLKNLVLLGVLHRFGKPIFQVRVWLNNQYAMKRFIKQRLFRR